MPAWPTGWIPRWKGSHCACAVWSRACRRGRSTYSSSASSPLPDGDSRSLPRLLELTWYDAPARIDAAETLELEVKLRRPRGFANPGGHDNEARMLRDHVGASGYVRSGERLGRDAAAAFRYPVLLARARVASIIRDTLGERPSAGIVAGLAVGLQDALSREQWLQLSRSGTSHLMAISGLHIAMVAAVFGWLGGRVQRLRQGRGATGATRDASVVAAAIAALGYSLLAGWSVPTQRTMVMIACGAAALLLRRRVGVADGLGLCVVGVLLLDPLAPLAPGFWLSFGAVAVILYGATGHVRPLGLSAQLPAGPGRRHAGARARVGGQLRLGLARVRARQPVRDPALHAADRACRARLVRRGTGFRHRRRGHARLDRAG